MKTKEPKQIVPNRISFDEMEKMLEEAGKLFVWATGKNIDKLLDYFSAVVDKSFPKSTEIDKGRMCALLYVYHHIMEEKAKDDLKKRNETKLYEGIKKQENKRRK